MASGQEIHCQHFSWRMYVRKSIYYADGRSKNRNLGRHSLATRDHDEALKNLARLDLVKAVDAGIADRSLLAAARIDGPSIEAGRQRYEGYLNRPEVAGGPCEATRKRYRAVFDHFCAFATKSGITRWGQVTDQVAQNYLASRSTAGAAKRTQYLEGTLLKQVLSYLVKSGELPAQARLEIQLAKPRGTSTFCWDSMHVEAMLMHCATIPSLTWLGDIVCGLARTGLRIGELLNLRWSDIRVHMHDGVIHVVSEIDAAIPNGEARRTKGRRSRSLPIHPDLLAVLKRPGRASGGYVFRGPRGGRLKPDDVRQALVRHVLTPLASRFPTAPGERGFVDGRLHSFRHFFVSQAANSGVPMKIVQEWLGHRNSEMVAHYFHLSDQLSQKFIRNVDFSSDEVAGSVALSSSVA